MNIAFVKLDDSLRIIMSGYLWKLSRSMVPTTTPGCASALVSKWSRRFFVLRADSCLYFFKKEQVNYQNTFNNRFLRERGMASNPKMEYQVFLCIFQKNSAMTTLGLKEMGKFLLEGKEKVWYYEKLGWTPCLFLS